MRKVNDDIHILIAFAEIGVDGKIGVGIGFGIESADNGEIICGRNSLADKLSHDARGAG